MVGGSSHAILTYTTPSLLSSLSESRSEIISFFPFPPISKITIQLMNTLLHCNTESDVITLSIQLMDNSPPLSQWHSQLSILLSTPFREEMNVLSQTCHSSVEAVFRWIESIQEIVWESYPTPPHSSISIQGDDRVLL